MYYTKNLLPTSRIPFLFRRLWPPSTSLDINIFSRCYLAHLCPCPIRGRRHRTRHCLRDKIQSQALAFIHLAHCSPHTTKSSCERQSNGRKRKRKTRRLEQKWQTGKKKRRALHWDEVRVSIVNNINRSGNVRLVWALLWKFKPTLYFRTRGILKKRYKVVCWKKVQCIKHLYFRTEWYTEKKVLGVQGIKHLYFRTEWYTVKKVQGIKYLYFRTEWDTVKKVQGIKHLHFRTEWYTVKNIQSINIYVSGQSGILKKRYKA